MIKIKKLIYCALGKLYIPQSIIESKEKKLLHISDTPLCFYSQLNMLIRKLKPAYIVHTGDMTDNFKLEFKPSLIYEHENGIRRLASILESSSAEIILAVGNHDNFDIVSKYFKRSLIIKEAETIKIEKISIRISHIPKAVQENPSQYNLFGHDLTLKNGRIDGKLYFNGISHINIIGLESGEYNNICYPPGTNDARLGRRKIGL